MKRLNYDHLTSNVLRIQSVFRSRSLSKRFRASQHKGLLHFISSKDRRSFVSCLFGTAAETIYFESYERPTVACQFDKRYSNILKSAMQELQPSEALTYEQFQTFIQEIEQRIH